MRLLITGAGGFIGRNLVEELGGDYELLAPSRTQLDLLDGEAVRAYLKRHSPHAVIHTAAIGVVRGQAADGVLEKNVRMFENLADASEHYGRLIQLGSGAEYDKSQSLVRVREEAFGARIPADEYGQSKYLCARRLERLEHAVSLRLFGCFGKYEDYGTRFISNNIARALYGMPALIANRNARFDYLDVRDLAGIIRRVLHKEEPAHQFYNATPDQTWDLASIAAIIERVSGSGHRLIVRHPGEGPAYTGDNARLQQEFGPIPFTPLEKSISELYAWYEERKDQIEIAKLGPRE